MPGPPIPLNSSNAFPVTQPIPNGNTKLCAMQYGGSLYWLVGEVDDNVTRPTTFALFKSTDGLIGATIVRVSAGPVFGEGYTQPIVMGGKVYVGYLDYADPGGGMGTFKVVGVTLATGVWDIPNSTGHTVALNRVTSTFFHIRPNGDFVITWDEYNAGFTASAVYSIIYSGGLWSAPVTISSTTFATIQQQSTISAANATGLLWAETDSGQNLISLRFSILTATTVTFTATALADASKIFGDTWYPMEPSLYDSGSDSVAFPMVRNFHSINEQRVELLVGTPSTAPAFGITNVITGTNADTFDMPQIVATATGFSILWINHLSTDQIQQTDATALTGTWNAPIVFWDEVATPIGPPVVPALGLFSLSASFIANQLAVNVGPYATVAGATWCGVQYFFSLIATPATSSPTNPGDGGRKPTVLVPNQFDFCLHREYRLFCNIDYDAKGCARLPKCFTVDEREWGEAG